MIKSVNRNSGLRFHNSGLNKRVCFLLSSRKKVLTLFRAGEYTRTKTATSKNNCKGILSHVLAPFSGSSREEPRSGLVGGVGAGTCPRWRASMQQKATATPLFPFISGVCTHRLGEKLLLNPV